MLQFMEDANYRKGVIDERDRVEAKADAANGTKADPPSELPSKPPARE
jgi:hypothetical protein